MIYRRKAETVRAIRLTDYSPALLDRMREFTQGRVVTSWTYYKSSQEYLTVVIDKKWIKMLKGDWLVHSTEFGWRKLGHLEFTTKYEEGEHGSA